MTREEFSRLTREGLLFLDGATGTNLQKAGMPAGVCPELWILEHPDALLRLQEAFAEAGSNILYAPTFGANRIKLQEYGLQDRLAEMNASLVGLSRQASAGRAFVAGDITMTGRQLCPIGSMQFEELVDIYKEQIRALCEAGVVSLAARPSLPRPARLFVSPLRRCVESAAENRLLSLLPEDMRDEYLPLM